MNAVCKRIAEEHEAKERNFLRYPLELSDLSKFPDRAPRKETILDVDDEPQDDDAWIVAAFERFDRPEFNEGGHHPREEWASNNKRRHFWHYTHGDFIRKAHKIGYHEFTQGCKRDGKYQEMECSILDRERGYINEPGDLPDELSWPMACIVSFDDIPYIQDPPIILDANDKDNIQIYAEYTDEELARCFKIINEKHNQTLPTTAKTIRKIRELPNHPEYFPVPTHQRFEGTPIGNLLKASPKTGRAAISNLVNYFMMWVFEGKDWCMWPREPTRRSMILCFMQGPRLQGVIFPKIDLAEKQFDLLVEYDVIKSLKRFADPEHELYYVTRKRVETTIPSVRSWEYYISINS